MWSTIQQRIPIKSIFPWKNKNSNAFDGMKNDEVMKELPVQLSPSPSYPGLHVQLQDTLVLLQTALELQL